MIIILKWVYWWCILHIVSVQPCDVSLATERLLVNLGSRVTLTCRVCPENLPVLLTLNGAMVADFWLSVPSVIDGSLYSISTNTINNITEISLTVLSFKVEMSGTYSCFKQGTTDIAFVNISYTVPVRYVGITPREDTVSLLDNVTTSIFSCTSSTGRPKPLIGWYTDNRSPGFYGDDSDITSFASSSTASNSSGDMTTSYLTFTPTADDNGERIYCNVSNGYGEIMSTATPLIDVLRSPSKPLIVDHGNAVSGIYQTIETQTVSLSCSSDGNPAPTVTWITPKAATRSTSVLTITNVQTNDAGVYTCRANSTLSPTYGQSVEVITSTNISADILYPPRAPECRIGNFNVTSNVVRAIRNESFQMTCTSVSNPPPSRYAWTHPFSGTFNGQDLSIEALKANGDNNYSIRIVNLMNPSFQQSVEGSVEQQFKFEILYPVTTPTLYHIGPIQPTEVNTITVIRGRVVHIQCHSSSNPQPNYVWSEQGVVSAQGEFWNQTINNNSYVICNASNCMDPTGKPIVCSSRFAYLNVTAYYPPEVPVLRFNTCGQEISTSHLKVVKGQSVKVSCISISKPDPTYTWEPNIPESSNVLHLENITLKQNGTYSCTAANVMDTTFDGTVYGTNMSTFHLEILVPPTVDRLETLTALLKTNLSVACPYTAGNPTVTTVQWMREHVLTMSGEHLSIADIKLTDEGRYKCTASNAMKPTGCSAEQGYAETSFYLDVQYAAQIKRYFVVGFENQTTISVKERDNVQLVCEFDSDPVANISIKNNTRMLESGQTQSLLATIPHARCEYDVAVYRCQGSNIHSTQMQEQVIEVFVKCAPRSSPFSPPVANISRTINGSVVLTFTIKAYPPPNRSAYSWYRLNGSTWEIIYDSRTVDVYVSADGLQTNLSISSLQSEDFGRYMVSVYNELGNATQEYELRAYDKPESPKNLHVKEGSLRVDSLTVEWEPGFNGGEEQAFVIQYKTKYSTKQWIDVNVSAFTIVYTLTDLHPGTTYLIKMYARNIAGKSEETDVVTAITLTQSETLDGAQPIAGIVGGSVSIVVAAVIVVFVIVIVRKRRVKESSNEHSHNRTSNRLKQPTHGFTAQENIGMIHTTGLKTEPETVGNKNAHQKETKPISREPDTNAHEKVGLKKTNSFAIERDPIYDNLIKERRNFKSRDISIKQLRKTVEDAQADPTDVFIEFSKLTAETDNIKYSTDAAKTSANMSKSRYKHMFPYDKNRVLLPIIDCDEDSDFINASFIDGYTMSRKYIAAQGPLASTITDTWRMIWSENIRVVAMVTNLVEDSKRKCYQYWPDAVNEKCKYEDYIVSVLTVEEYADFVIRKLHCSKVGSRDMHIVTHCHFTSWPDKNVPDTALSLLQFWRKVRSVHIEGNSPWMVHCSAGVGRTGTFIALDYLYDQGMAEKQVNLFDAILKLREQRINMVQTKLQYLYLHEVMCEALCPVGDVLTNTVYAGSNMSNDYLNQEYEILEHAHFHDFVEATADDDYSKILVGEKPENKRKNVDPATIPEDKYRPVLNLFVHVKGHNDYINAVYISTFLEQDKLILTQSASTSSEIDFVRLLHDHYVKTIVTFCDEVHSFVPVDDKVLVLGPFAATLISSSQRGHIRDTSIVYKRIGEQQGFDVRVLQFTKWPKHASVCEAEDLLNIVIDVQEFETEGPVVIQCHDGYTQSGLFAVMWCVVERIKRDGEVAVAETVRMVRKRRKPMIINATQYRFCHECARKYIEGCN